MSDVVSAIRTVMAVDDATFSLASGQDVADLERRIEDAVHGGGRFERFTVMGDRDVRVLFTAHTRVVLWTERTPDETPEGEPPTFEWDGG